MRVGIDGDIVLYRSAAACEKRNYVYYDKDEPEFGPVASFRYKKDAKLWLNGEEDAYIEKVERILDPVTYCYYSINHTLRAIKAALRATSIQIVISGTKNFRKEAYSSYKEGRPPKPAYYEQAKSFMVEEHGAVVTGLIEADDWLGIEQVAGNIDCICTIDKDLDMIPGWHYNYVKKDLYFLNEEEAKKWFWIQMLVGDNVDNIKGVTGVGGVKAEQLVNMLDTDEQREGFVQGMYENVEGDTDGDLFRKNKELLWILREPLSD